MFWSRRKYFWIAPNNLNSPLDGSNNPANNLNTVDFHDPDGPIIAILSPGFIVRLTLLRTEFVPHCIDKSSSSTTGDVLLSKVLDDKSFISLFILSDYKVVSFRVLLMSPRIVLKCLF